MTYHRIIPLILVPLSLIATARADDPRVDSQARSPLQQLIDGSLEWYELSVGSQGEVPLTATPVLRWDNNTRGSATGLTVLYIGNGRPEAVCAIYPWEGRLVHEFDSLSLGPIRGSEEGEVFWSTDEPGVAFQPISGAEVPHSRRAARLRQMKQLSQRFDVTLVGWRRDDSDRQPLRLLPRPIYRYEQPTGDILDGAVFAFVMGVDPEALLLIEAVGTDESARWEYALVRRTSGELSGRLDGETVWSVERFPETRNPEKPHRSMPRPLELPDAPEGEPAQNRPLSVPGTTFNRISTTDLEQ